MTRDEPALSERIPLVEDEPVIDIAQRVTGRVRVRTRVQTEDVRARGELARQDVEVERVVVDRYVDQAPDLRHEGDVLIVPVLEEVLVTEKRLLLKEELRIRLVRTLEPVEAPVTVRRMHADIDRDAPEAPPASPPYPKP